MTSKRFEEAKKKIDKNKAHSLEEAANICKATAGAKFDETVELHFLTGIDPKQGDQQIRGTVILPHGTGKTKRVAAFVDSANEKAAKDAGADIIGTEEVIEKIIKTGKIDFDVAIAVPTMMPKLAKAARILGPRGLMPNPKTDTVGTNVAKMIEEQKGGKVAFKNDDTSNVHMIIGKASFDEAKLLENLITAVEAIKKAKPNSTKGVFIKSASISCTMGPAVKLDTTKF
ncbi:MAG: 50S ribosomal protein L1 [Patescibacteria group bacterium]